MEARSYFFIYTNCIVGAVLIILLLLALHTLESIISAPIVQRSKESNISLWLTLPILGCFAGGAALLFTPKSLAAYDFSWIGVCYLITGATFLVSALLGWVNLNHTLFFLGEISAFSYRMIYYYIHSWFISKKSVMNVRDKTHKQIAVYLFIIMMFLTISAVGKYRIFNTTKIIIHELGLIIILPNLQPRFSYFPWCSPWTSLR